MQPQFYISKSEFGFTLSTISVTDISSLISHVQNLRAHHLLIRILYLLYVFLECLPRSPLFLYPFTNIPSFTEQLLSSRLSAETVLVPAFKELMVCWKRTVAV